MDNLQAIKVEFVNADSIDYASLYGVKPNENDFSGAINRCRKEGIKHLNKNFIVAINDIITQRHRHYERNRKKNLRK